MAIEHQPDVKVPGASAITGSLQVPSDPALAYARAVAEFVREQLRDQVKGPLVSAAIAMYRAADEYYAKALSEYDDMEYGPNCERLANTTFDRASERLLKAIDNVQWTVGYSFVRPTPSYPDATREDVLLVLGLLDGTLNREKSLLDAGSHI